MPFISLVPYEVPLIGASNNGSDSSILANSLFIDKDNRILVYSYPTNVLAFPVSSLKTDLLEQLNVAKLVSLAYNLIPVVYQGSAYVGSYAEDEALQVLLSSVTDASVNSDLIFTKSIYLDGAGDYVTFPYVAADFDWTGSFTLEMWIKPTGSGLSYVDGPAHPTLFGNRDVASTGDNWSFGPINTGELRLYYYTGSPNSLASGLTVNLNQWNHIALTKSASGVAMHLNGVSSTRAAITAPFVGSLPHVFGQGNNTSYQGNIASVRLTAGASLYEGPYTIPSPAFAADASTRLLTFQDDTIVDSSAQNKTLTVVGDTVVSNDRPSYL